MTVLIGIFPSESPKGVHRHEANLIALHKALGGGWQVSTQKIQ